MPSKLPHHSHLTVDRASERVVKPRALDLFCGAGGATRGLQQAGFHVTGIDIKKQPRYVGDRFIQADALKPPVRLGDFDLIWASPPCQAYSIANNIHGRANHPDRVTETRELLESSNRNYVIENVPGAPLRAPITLCGLSFDLNVKRHRLFEASFLILAPPCGTHDGDWVMVFGNTVLERSKTIGRTAKGGPRFRRKHLGIEVGRKAMAINWMNCHELSQAIPPPYAEFIGSWAIRHLKSEAPDA